MKKRNLKVKLTLKKNLVSNLQAEEVKGAGTNICSGTQDTCINCEQVTRFPCVRPTRGDWTCYCPQN